MFFRVPQVIGVFGVLPLSDRVVHADRNKSVCAEFSKDVFRSSLRFVRNFVDAEPACRACRVRP